MKRSQRIIAAIAPVLLLAPASAFAASDYLLQLDGVEGESRTTMEVASWSFGASNPTSVGSSGMSAGRIAAPSQPLAADGSVRVVTARERGSGLATGRAACATGKHFPTAIISSRREAWTLTEVLVSSCNADGMTISYRTATPAPVPDAMRLTKTRSNIQNN